VRFDGPDRQDRHLAVPCPAGVRKILSSNAIYRHHVEQQESPNLLIRNGFIRPRKSQDVPEKPD
jgi:hypothetical protein